MILLSVSASAVIGLHIVATFFPSATNWGFHHLAFLPASMKIVIPLLMVAVMIPKVQNAIIKVLTIVVKRVQESSKSTTITLLIVALVAACVLFWFGRQTTFFLGDGMFVLRGLKNIQTNDDIAKVFINAPLSGFFVWHIHQFLASLNTGLALQTAFQVFGVSIGILMMIVVGFFVKNLTDNAIDQALAFCFIIFGGAIQLFFGYVENYSLAVLTGTSFALLCLMCLKGRVHIIVPSLAFGLMVASHFVLIIMLPVLVFVSVDWVRSKKTILSSGILAVVVAFLLTVFFTMAIFWMCGYSPDEVITEFAGQGSVGRHVVPIAEKSAGWHAYTMFSLWHAIDLANLYMLLSPFSLIIVLGLALPTLRNTFSIQSQLVALGLLAFIGLLFTITFNSDIGMSRDWDLMAIYNVGLVLFAAPSWFLFVTDEVVRRRMMVMMAGLTLLQSISWVSVNAGKKASTMRFTMLRDERLWGPAALAYANEELGNFYRDRGEVLQAVTYFEEGIGLDSMNSRRWTVLGNAYHSLGEEESMLYAYTKAVETGTKIPEVCDHLLRLSAKYQRVDEALEALRIGLERDPQALPLLYYLGFGLSEYRLEYEEATFYLLQALTVNPHFPQAYETLGYCYYQLKKFPEMRSTWERYLELMPNSASAPQIRRLMKSVE